MASTVAVVPGLNGCTFANITCHACNDPGHYADQCLVVAQEEGAQQQVGFSFSQIEKWSSKFKIPKTWILLDNQSTVDVFHNRDMLQNIHTVDRRMYIHCNAGTQWTDQQGDLPGYGRVWYCPHAIANILSLHNVTRRYRVTYNSSEGNQFIVTKEDGKENVFHVSQSGLFYFDVKAADNDSMVLVNTVKENKTRYTNAEVSRAEEARTLQCKIG